MLHKDEGMLLSWLEEVEVALARRWPPDSSSGSKELTVYAVFISARSSGDASEIKSLSWHTGLFTSF